MSDASNTDTWATRYDPAAEHKAIVDQLAAECAAEHERGDQYRARALCLLRSPRHERDVTELLQGAVSLAEQYVAEHERAETWLARAAERGLTVEMLRGMLAEACEYTRHSEGCSRPFGEEYYCRCGWAEFEPRLAAALADGAGGGVK